MGDPAHLAEAIRLFMLAVPFAAIALSVVVMLANPLKRNTHAGIVAALSRGER